MADNVEKLSFEAHGRGSVKSIIGFLENLDEDSSFNRVYVEVSQEKSETGTNIKQASLPMAENDAGEDFVKSTIQKGTSHHEVLSALETIKDKAPVPTKEVLNIVDLPEGTVYAAMSALHERGLVNRTDEKNANNSYEYEVSERGKEELDRLGVIN